MTFTKLFSSITESTIWCEDSETRIVWITMLAMANKNGFVFGSVPGLASRAKVTVESTKIALGKFLSPDEYSRTKDHEGRRIEEVDGGWRLLNYEKHRDREGPYRGMESEGYVYYIGEIGADTVKIGFSANPWARLCDLRVTNPQLEILAVERGTMRAEKDRHAQFSSERAQGEWFRASHSLMTLVSELSQKPTTLQKRNYTSNVYAKAPTTVVPTIPTVAPEAEAEAEADKPKTFVRPTIEEVTAYCQLRQNAVDPEAWMDHYTANGWKVGKSAMRNWQASVRQWERNPIRPHGTDRSERMSREANIGVWRPQ